MTSRSWEHTSCHSRRLSDTQCTIMIWRDEFYPGQVELEVVLLSYVVLHKVNINLHKVTYLNISALCRIQNTMQISYEKMSPGTENVWRVHLLVSWMRMHSSDTKVHKWRFVKWRGSCTYSTPLHTISQVVEEISLLKRNKKSHIKGISEWGKFSVYCLLSSSLCVIAKSGQKFKIN